MLGLTSQKQGCENRHAPGRNTWCIDTSRCFHCTFSLSSDCEGCNASFLVDRITVKVALSVSKSWGYGCACRRNVWYKRHPKLSDYENNRSLVVLFIVISWVKCCFPGQSPHRAPLWLPYWPLPKEVQDHEDLLTHERNLAIHHQALIWQVMLQERMVDGINRQKSV